MVGLGWVVVQQGGLIGTPRFRPDRGLRGFGCLL